MPRMANQQPGQAHAPGVTIAARLDRLPLTRLHIAVVCLCTAGFAFDFLEVAMSNILSAVFAQSTDPLTPRWLWAPPTPVPSSVRRCSAVPPIDTAAAPCSCS
jgi:hypothetical protein